MKRSDVRESILTDRDDLFDATGAFVRGVGPSHQVIFFCRGCRRWQVDMNVDDLAAISATEQLAQQHFNECSPLQLAVALNKWWSAVATRQRRFDEIWIGDLLDRLRPLAEWHHRPNPDAPVQTIVACRFCNWQADAPSVALYDERACLYALNEHRQDCRTLDTMAALTT